MQTALTDIELRRAAPSVFATEPWERTSDRYTFIPTIEVVEKLRTEGFMPVRAMQSKTRIEGKGEFTKHMIRFRRADDLTSTRAVGDELPEIVLTNSHDRSSSYELSAGVFRLACLNGLVVKSADFGSIRVHHTGDIVGQVIEGSARIIEEMPQIMDRVERYKQLILNPAEETVFAEAAMELRYPSGDAPYQPYSVSNQPFDPKRLLMVRRSQDASPNLWNVSNRVQENLMRGGIRGQGKTGRNMTSRRIASVNEEMRLNKALWTLTECMADLKRYS